MIGPPVYRRCLTPATLGLGQSWPGRYRSPLGKNVSGQLARRALGRAVGVDQTVDLQRRIYQIKAAVGIKPSLRRLDGAEGIIIKYPPRRTAEDIRTGQGTFDLEHVIGVIHSAKADRIRELESA